MKGEIKMKKIETLTKVTKTNATRLVNEVKNLKTPRDRKEYEDLMILIKIISDEREDIPRGGGYSGIRRTYTWCINTIEARLSEYDLTEYTI